MNFEGPDPRRDRQDFLEAVENSKNTLDLIHQLHQLSSYEDETAAEARQKIVDNLPNKIRDYIFVLHKAISYVDEYLYGPFEEIQDDKPVVELFVPEGATENEEDFFEDKLAGAILDLDFIMRKMGIRSKIEVLDDLLSYDTAYCDNLYDQVLGLRKAIDGFVESFNNLMNEFIQADLCKMANEIEDIITSENVTPQEIMIVLDLFHEDAVDYAIDSDVDLHSRKLANKLLRIIRMVRKEAYKELL